MGARPSHAVYLVDKDTKVYTKVGVGWETFKDKINIKLNPGVVLDWRMNFDFYINVNKNSEDGYSEPDMEKIPF